MPTWTQKLKRIVEERDRNVAQIERVAGLKPNTLQTSLSRGNEPQAGKAIALAKALGVTVEWLFNDELGFDEMPSRPLSEQEEARVLLDRCVRSLNLVTHALHQIDSSDEAIRRPVSESKQHCHDVTELIWKVIQMSRSPEERFEDELEQSAAQAAVGHGDATLGHSALRKKTGSNG